MSVHWLGNGSVFALKAHVGQPVCAGFFAAAAVVWFHDIVGTQCVVVIVVLAVVCIVLITVSICLATHSRTRKPGLLQLLQTGSDHHETVATWLRKHGLG